MSESERNDDDSGFYDDDRNKEDVADERPEIQEQTSGKNKKKKSIKKSRKEKTPTSSTDECIQRENKRREKECVFKERRDRSSRRDYLKNEEGIQIRYGTLFTKKTCQQETNLLQRNRKTAQKCKMKEKLDLCL